MDNLSHWFFVVKLHHCCCCCKDSKNEKEALILRKRRLIKQGTFSYEMWSPNVDFLPISILYVRDRIEVFGVESSIADFAFTRSEGKKLRSLTRTVSWPQTSSTTTTTKLQSFWSSSPDRSQRHEQILAYPPSTTEMMHTDCILNVM